MEVDICISKGAEYKGHGARQTKSIRPARAFAVFYAPRVLRFSFLSLEEISMLSIQQIHALYRMNEQRRSMVLRSQTVGP